jgi:F420-dependent oxidoreductase-like protein
VRVAIGAGGAASAGDHWGTIVDFVVEAENLGADGVWTAEAWGMDAVSTAAFLAARTNTMMVGTGIMQISARAPSMTAMTALSMASMTGDRFILGLGASGPQVVEGLHGWRFDKPIGRMREYIEIIRMAFRGEKLEYHGDHYDMPLPEGEGKPLRLAQAANENVPIYLATLSPKALRLTGELADGWVGTSFTPEGAAGFTDYIKAGAEKAGRSLADIDLQVGGTVQFGDDVDAMVRAKKAGVAFQLGAMGSADHNFYNDAFKRGGYEEAGRNIQRLWIERKRDEAVAAVPDEMVLNSNMLGTKEMVKDRMRAYRDAGITTLRVDPHGETLNDRLDTLGQAIELVREVSAESATAARS